MSLTASGGSVSTRSTQNTIVSMQGIQVPASSVNPQAFQGATRRQNLLVRTVQSFAGFGQTDLTAMLQTGIISDIGVRISGSLTVTGGPIASTYLWPYGIVDAFRFTANGQSNLINISGWTLKAMGLASRAPQDDRGVANNVGGANPGTVVTQGTLALASESWGVGQGVTGIPNGTYDVELYYNIPVAYDPISLLGAIFAQTASTDLELAIQYAPLANLFVLPTGAQLVANLSVLIEATVYTIPGSSNGGILIPNLSAFHSLIESPSPNFLAVGVNMVTLAGQGVGRQLMRLGWRVLPTGPLGAPLAMNRNNYGPINWLYGGNTTPETFQDGGKLRHWDEQLYNTDIGGVEGYGVFDFSSLWAPRDAVDQGAATQLRFSFTINPSVTLASPACSYVQQVITAGAVAA